MCINTALTNITHTTTGATGIGTATNLPAGVTAAWVSNTLTISGTPTASGTFNYSIPLTGGCGAVTATGSIVVTPNNTVALSSAAGTDAQTKCINTAITNITYNTTTATGATFSGLPAGVSGAWASNVATISGTPSASGTFNYTVTLTGGCGAVTATGSIVVTPNNTVGGSITGGSTPICQGSSTGTMTLSGHTGSVVKWQKQVNGGGYSDIVNSATTYSEVPSSAGTWDYRAVVQNGSCTSVDSGVTTVTVSPASVGGTIAGSATVCTGTNSTVLTLSGNTGAITRWESSLDNFATAGTSIANTTITLTATNLTATTYYRAVITSGSCAAVNSASATVTLSNTWKGTFGSNWFTASNWSCESIPTANTDVIIPNGSQLIVDGTSTIALANTITVSASSSLTVNSGNTLKVTDKLTNNGGTITFEDSASLVQTNDVVNSGNILYKRRTSILAFNYDFVYWSSPVKQQKIGKIWMASNWADTFYNFNPAGNSWARTYEANEMIPGKGYIARARNGQYGENNQQFTVTNKWIAPFSGVPNNGTITVTDCVAGRDCLLGNPYPSAIDADEFLKQNSTVLEGTLYFWTHSTAMINNAYNSNDYACYNSSGSVATTRGNLVSQGSNENNKPTGKIAAGQSFFATAKGTAAIPTTVEFNNTMRIGAEGAPLVNTQFFRTSSTAKAKTANSIEKNRVWLNLSNAQGAFKQTLVGYVTDATNGYESRFDGESFDGNTYVDFYSINQGKNFTIQGRAVPFDQNDTVPLGFKTTIEGSFTIDIDEVDGLLTNQAVYLEDKVTNTVSNLKNSSYTFTTAKGTFNDRFVLRYTDKTLSIDDTDKEDGILVFYSNNYKTLIIKNKVMDSTVNSVALFNMAGQNIEKWDVKDSGQTNIQIPIKNIPSGIYIVKVKTTKGESSKKIIVN